MKLRSEWLVGQFFDFWLLGGMSIIVWAIMVIGQLARPYSAPIENHFMQIGAVFSMLSIFFNHPHFMISYRFSYGRGIQFIWAHAFSLIIIPILLIAFYALAYFKFDSKISDLPWIMTTNHFFNDLGLSFQLGTMTNLGNEILSLSILFMNITVGWHYSKQVFGCMMVYAHYDQYILTQFQRFLIKISLFSVAFFNFFYVSIKFSDKNYFSNIPMFSLKLPPILITLTGAIVTLSGIAVIIFVFLHNLKKYQKKPSLNLLIPWLAFHIWWIPIVYLPEYYFLMIPFFHSLQYLPFAYRMELPTVTKGNFRYLSISFRIALLLTIGFCAFEIIPSLLDTYLETSWYLQTWFFMISIAVFINIHHFFMDSVIWKFNQSNVKNRILMH